VIERVEVGRGFKASSVEINEEFEVERTGLEDCPK